MASQTVDTKTQATKGNGIGKRWMGVAGGAIVGIVFITGLAERQAMGHHSARIPGTTATTARREQATAVATAVVEPARRSPTMTVYLVGTSEQARAVRKDLREENAQRMRSGELTLADLVLVVDTPDAAAQARGMIKYLRVDLGPQAVAVAHLSTAPAGQQ